MGALSKKALDQGQKEQREILEEFLTSRLLSNRFTREDRILVAKLMQLEYKQGFLNGSALRKNKN